MSWPRPRPERAPPDACRADNGRLFALCRGGRYDVLNRPRPHLEPAMRRTGPGRHGTTRRGFLLGATAGLAAGGTAAWLAARTLQRLEPDRPRFTGRSREDRSTELAMPGPYPGRVIRVRHPAAVRPDHTPEEAVVRR